jgi:hypothetical protein
MFLMCSRLVFKGFNVFLAAVGQPVKKKNVPLGAQCFAADAGPE